MEERISQLEKENQQILRVSKMLQKDLEEARQSEEIQKDAAFRLR